MDNSESSVPVWCVVQGKMNDPRGISRGKCKSCSNCSCYRPPCEGLRCSQCGCPPGKHVRSQQGGICNDYDYDQGSNTIDSFVAVQHSQTLPCNTGASLCTVPHCGKEVGFDVNSGLEHSYCSVHAAFDSIMTVEDIELDDDDPFGYGYFPDQTFTSSSHLQDSSQCRLQASAKDNSLCIIPECYKPKYFDSASGVTHDYCGKTHAEEGKIRGIQRAPNVYDQGQGGQASTLGPTSAQVFAPPGVPKCAIAECPNSPFVDGSGTVHECCGITHAMEHQRRQALWKQVNQQVVKGITHCLLPECNRQTWPFENYCGRSHADFGIQRGLVPPPPVTGNVAQMGPKDSSLCIIPGCQKAKFVDSSTGATYDYCGKSHAEEGKKKGIYATTDKVQDQCDLPNCTNKKRTEGGTVYDYCCLDHAQKDAPNRDARILTSAPEIQKFLGKFSNLKVVCMKENDHAKPGGALFNKFKNAMMGLPANQRSTCLAFHGTAESNIDSICQTGYNPKKRSGQAYGAGEYFATSPNIPLNYCKGGKKMLLNELLLGQSGTHHTKHGDIVVMKKPEHDLPRFVITFK